MLRAGEWLRSDSECRRRLGRKLRQLRQRNLHRGAQHALANGLGDPRPIAGGDTNSLSVQHGIEYLLETQRPDGSWDEELATGTGFPNVFYLNYHLYKDYFPLLALSSFVKARANSNG